MGLSPKRDILGDYYVFNIYEIIVFFNINVRRMFHQMYFSLWVLGRCVPLTLLNNL